ncbi:MAG: methyltransferase family protein [Candidatus Hodarchaeota archaeon]
MGLWGHVKAFILLPLMVTLIIPTFILIVTGEFHYGWFLLYPFNIFPIVGGCSLIVLGLFVLGKTIHLFAKIGKGTLSPWEPPKKLVVHGIYRHVRNPMIWGVLIILLGESVLFGSPFLIFWFIIFFIGNHIYFIKVEEPNLVSRFGEAYIHYMKQVPRWIPRLKPWTGFPCKKSNMGKYDK